MSQYPPYGQNMGHIRWTDEISVTQTGDFDIQGYVHAHVNLQVDHTHAHCHQDFIHCEGGNRGEAPPNSFSP